MKHVPAKPKMMREMSQAFEMMEFPTLNIYVNKLGFIPGVDGTVEEIKEDYYSYVCDFAKWCNGSVVVDPDTDDVLGISMKEMHQVKSDVLSSQSIEENIERVSRNRLGFVRAQPEPIMLIGPGTILLRSERETTVNFMVYQGHTPLTDAPDAKMGEWA